MANVIGPPVDIFQSAGGGGGGGGGGTVTHVTGPLTLNQVILGDGGADIKPIGTYGSTSTVLHGNSGTNPPTYGPVVLTTDVSGILPIANGGTGSATQNFWDLTTNQTSAGNKLNSGILQGITHDIGGEVFDVKSSIYGAVGNGITDDTVAIQAAITAAAAITPRGIVYFPPGTYKTTGNFDITGLRGLKIVGSGCGSTIIDLNHATNNLFTLGDPVDRNAFMTFKSFSVTSVTATRTAGWVIDGNGLNSSSVGMCRFYDLEIQNQFNGIRISESNENQLANITLTNFAGPGIGVQLGKTTSVAVNRGADNFLSDIYIAAFDPFSFSGDSGPDIGLLLYNCQTTWCTNVDIEFSVTNCLKLIADPLGDGVYEDRFVGCSFVGTKSGAAAYVTGSGNFLDNAFIGCIFALAGSGTGGSNGANGLKIDSGGLNQFVVSGCSFEDNKGTGLYVDPFSYSAVAITGCSIRGNGTGNQSNNKDGVFVSTPTGVGTGPTITGCAESGSTGVGLRTDTAADGVIETGNAWSSGTSFGVNPTASDWKRRYLTTASGFNFILGGSGADVASAATITPTGSVFHVTGTTTVTDMTVAVGGTVAMIVFDGILTFTDGNHLKLAGNLTTAANTTITLVSDGTNWQELCRSVN